MKAPIGPGEFNFLTNSLFGLLFLFFSSDYEICFYLTAISRLFSVRIFDNINSVCIEQDSISSDKLASVT